MASSGFASIALTVAAAALLAAAWRLQARIHIGEDFALARRRLPGALTGLSQAVNCVPAWLLMALALLAYSTGLAAVWMALTTLLGLAINWWFIAPKLRAQATAAGCQTLSQWFAASAGDDMQAVTRRSAAAIVVFSMGCGTLTFIQWAAQSLANVIGISVATALVLLLLVMLATTMLAGIWAASVADVAQAGLLLFMLLTLAVYALIAVGGWSSLWSALAARESATGRWFGGYSGVLAIALWVGLLFGALGSAAQPHVVDKYLACRDDAALRRARQLAMAWSAVALLCALVAGWCARALLANDARELNQGRALLSALTNQTMPDSLASFIAVCLIIVFAVACASPWIAAATHLASDLRNSKEAYSPTRCRVMLAGFVLLLGAAAMYLPPASEDRLWLCWHSLSAAFGPLLLVRLTGKKVRPGSLLGAMWSGFVLTVLFHLMPDTPGDLLERCLPFIAAMGIALSGGEQRRNPNRADRGDKTVHDHLPI
jgi:sodium/proline symporter